MPKIKKSKIYWDDTIEEKIAEYKLETDVNKRNLIFQNYLYKPINTLIENIVYRYKLYNFDNDGINDIKQQCNVFVLEKVLPKYDVNRKKSFAYIGTSIKRYLIQSVKASTEFKKKSISIDRDLNKIFGHDEYVEDNDNNILNSIAYSYNIDDDDVPKDILDKFIDTLREEADLLRSVNEKVAINWVTFLDSFITICENRSNVDFIDKRAIFSSNLGKMNGFPASRNYSYTSAIKDRYNVFLQKYKIENL